MGGLVARSLILESPPPVTGSLWRAKKMRTWVQGRSHKPYVVCPREGNSVVLVVHVLESYPKQPELCSEECIVEVYQL